MFNFIKQNRIKNRIKFRKDKDKNKNDNENKNKNENILSNRINELNKTLLKSNILEITTLIGNKKELFFRNFMAGIARGVGIGIGITIITAIIVLLLQKIVTLNIPIIGEYIRDIVDIVMKSKIY